LPSVSITSSPNIAYLFAVVDALILSPNLPIQMSQHIILGPRVCLTFFDDIPPR